MTYALDAPLVEGTGGTNAFAPEARDSQLRLVL
jgi:hypothetical protein